MKRFVFLAACLAVTGGAGSRARASDWPAYRHDAQRSACTDETPAFPLKPAWRYTCAQPPRPAWLPPPRKINQMDFDYAPAPVVAEGILCFGSTADDTIRALDAATGAERWRFTTGGPVRFAPQIESNRVYAAADDGRVYCLDAASGQPVWTFDCAPADEMYIGNRRMISRWPVRTGVLVRDGVVYAVAGSWSTEGVYVYGLDAATGRVVWRNDEGGLQARGTGLPWRSQDPHMGEFSFTGPTPQGALLASRDCLIVPMGLNSPAVYSLATGALLKYTPLGGGGAGYTLDGSMRYNFITGEKNKGMSVFGCTVPDAGVMAKALEIPVSEVPQFSPRAQRARFRFQSHDRGKVSAIIRDGKHYIRKAYGLVLAGNSLIVGEDGAVSAVDPATDRELWRAPVNGEARELAVAGGRLYVSTHTGEITCFAPAGEKTEDRRPRSDASRQTKTDRTQNGYKKQDAAGSIKIVSALRQGGMDRGVALVLGDREARVALDLAAGTDLHVIVPVTDTAAALALREELLSTTALYGTRIHVVEVGSLARLPFAQYVANAIVVAGPAAGLSGRELGRLLRPCGGLLLAPGLPPAEAEALCRQAATVESCTGISLEGMATVRRGALPGARDWNVNVDGDRRVAWPLRPLWFGGPDPAHVMNTISGSHPPVAADGRYFVIGQDCLTAVDAYNGTTLWTRPIPSATPDVRQFNGLDYGVSNGIRSDLVAQWKGFRRWLAVDGSNVYLRLGAGYGGGTNEDALIQLDARTGEQLRYFGSAQAGPRIALDAPQTWNLEPDGQRGGSVSLARTEEGLSLTLAASVPVVAWDLHFDFRPEPRRYGLYDAGAFMTTVYPAGAAGTAPRVEPGTGALHPELRVTGTDARATTTVILPWAEIGRLTGGAERPASFGFAVALNTWTDDSAQSVTQQVLFCGPLAPGLNNGWATILLSGGELGAPGALPAVVGGGWAQRPGTWPVPETWEEDPLYRVSPGMVDPAVRNDPRRHPLTGEPGPRTFRRGTGQCGNPVYAARMQIGRTTKTALGFYDFMEDGGLHFFPGIGPNCGVHTRGVNAAAALGLVFLSESRGHCDCMIPIRTSIAFAPAERRLNEDWALFCERNADAPVRHLAANLGAFGDRRADDGTLWLSVPREAGGKAYPTEPGSRRYAIVTPPQSGTLQVPVSIGFLAEFRTKYYRVNADRAGVTNTAAPWIYASGCAGLTNLVVRLRDLPWLIASAAAVPPVLDGRLDDPAWAGSTQAVLPFTRTAVRLRHDAAGLYVSAWRPAIVRIKGDIEPWIAATTGEDAEVWADDAFELFLGDARGGRVVHLGVSASGARYDALSEGAGGGNRAWTAPWVGVACADSNGFGVELAIPWATLAAAGLDRSTLALNAQMNQSSLDNELVKWGAASEAFLPEPERRRGLSEPLQSLGPAGRAHGANLVAVGFDGAPELTPRRFTVRLFFADLVEGNAPGTRVFDVRAQGRPVLTRLDIVKEAGAPRTALMKELRGIPATDTLTLDFVPATDKPTPATAPILSALEILEED